MAEAKAELNISKNITSELEKKIAAAESEVCKVFRESKHWKEALTKKDDEITALKTSIKNSIGEKQQLSVDLQNQKKSLKLKDKEIHSLEIYKFNHQETVKTLKGEVSELKKNNKTLERQVKIVEKKVTDMKKEKQQESNNNKPTVAYPSTVSISVFSSSPIPFTPTHSSPLPPSSASTAPAWKTKPHPVLSLSPLGEEGDKFIETLKRQQKEIEDWFESYIDEG